MADFNAVALEQAVAYLSLTVGFPDVRLESIERATAALTLQQANPVYLVATETAIATAQIYIPQSQGPPTFFTVAQDILMLWGGCSCGDDETVRNEVTNVINAAVQFIHANGRELSYIGNRTRYYLAETNTPAAARVLKLDADILLVDGYVKSARPWKSFYFSLNTPTTVPVDYDPFGAGYSLILSFGDSDAWRVTISTAGLTAATLQDAIQALITNEARVWVTYRAKMYLKITFDTEPVFVTSDTHNVAARPAIVEIDFTTLVGGAPDLQSKGLLIRESSGDLDNFWFNVDTAGVAPIQGDFTFEVAIFSGDSPTEWAAALAALIDAQTDYAATAGGGVVTVTAQYNSPYALVTDGIPATGLTITTAQSGSDGADASVLFPEGPEFVAMKDDEGAFQQFGVIEDDGTAPQALNPCATEAELDNYALLYGSDAPQAYYLERQHVKASDSCQVYLLFAPPLAADAIISMEVQIEPQRYGWADYDARTVIPIPHAYVESLLMPVVRWYASASKRYRQRERHESLIAHYKDALKILGIVDPQTSAVKDGKEGE